MAAARRTIIPRLIACSILLVSILSSCADKIKTDIIAFEALDEGLVNSNMTIQKSSETFYASLEQKITEPSTSEKAKIWLPKATAVQKQSAKAHDYIEELKTDLKIEAGLKTGSDSKSFKESDKNSVMRLFEKKGKGEELLERLKNYKHDILAVDGEFDKEFNNSIFLTTRDFEAAKEKQDFSKTFFHDIPVAAALAMLSRFQNNIRVSENKIAAYCNNKVGSTGGGYTTYSAVAVISSSYVKAGEQIEITSGIGAFSKSLMPEITINGKKVDIDVDGAVHYKFKASDKPGKYSVPVVISFTDQDGKKQTIQKNIQYTVAD